MQTPKVSVGPTTVAGYAATLVGLVATALVAVLNVDQEQALLVASAVWTVGSFVVTQVGRYMQATKAATPVAPPQVGRYMQPTKAPVAPPPQPAAEVDELSAPDFSKDPFYDDDEPPSGPDPSALRAALDDPEKPSDKDAPDLSEVQLVQSHGGADLRDDEDRH